MTNEQSTYITKDGLQKLQDELHMLKNEKRREIADRINQAKELGDLSENAEYVEAKTEQSFLEGRIIDLEEMVRNAVVISTIKHSGTVEIGTTFIVKTGSTTMQLSIVGSNEADPTAGRISNASPLGSTFLGHKVGDVVEVKTPRGITTYTIESIE